MVPLVIVGLFVKFGVSVVFLSGFVQEREVGGRSGFCSGSNELLLRSVFALVGWFGFCA
jgi:hypothetical protein